MHISENIRQARVSADKTQQQMADHLKVKRSTYANWETTIEPDFATIEKIANFLDKEVADLTTKHTDLKPNNVITTDKTDISIEAIRDLAKGNIVQSETVKVLADSNAKLIAILGANFYGDSQSPSNTEKSLLEQIAKAGLGKALKWTSMDEGLALLGKLIVSGSVIKQE